MTTTEKTLFEMLTDSILAGEVVQPGAMIVSGPVLGDAFWSLSVKGLFETRGGRLCLGEKHPASTTAKMQTAGWDW